MFETKPRCGISSLELSDVNRMACLSLIEEQQRSNELRDRMLEPRNRVLLVGPPGNGKTSLAGAIAEALAIPFFVVRYETMIGSFLGETGARLKKVFDYARSYPCVLFFDEFDTIGKERGDVHETGEIKRVVSTLLMMIDELPSSTVLIGATNHPELLDRASWRRFQLRLVLNQPDFSALVDYISKSVSVIDGRLCKHAEMIAGRLGKDVSYADAEEFCGDLSRRYVLDRNNIDSELLLYNLLSEWDERILALEHAETLKAIRGASLSDDGRVSRVSK